MSLIFQDPSWAWIASGVPNEKRTRLWRDTDGVYLITVDHPTMRLHVINVEGLADGTYSAVTVVLETTDRQLAARIFGDRMEGATP